MRSGNPLSEHEDLIITTDAKLILLTISHNLPQDCRALIEMEIHVCKVYHKTFDRMIDSVMLHNSVYSLGRFLLLLIIQRAY